MKSDTQLPKHYVAVMSKHPKVSEAFQNLREVLQEEGPLDEKTTQLIQLAAAAGIRSEGSVHSHAKRAIAAGATPDEIRHVLLLLMTTLGFPTAMAAMSWVADVLEVNP